MEKKNHEFLKRLLATFETEADEHVRAMSSRLLELEKASPANQKPIIEAVFREAHSLKGAARAVNLLDIETFCQTLESVFSELRSQSFSLSPIVFDVLHKAVDSLGEAIHSRRAGGPAPEKTRIAEAIQALDATIKDCRAKPKAREIIKQHDEAAAQHAAVAPAPAAIQAPASSAETSLPRETVRISTAKLNTLMLEAEELLAVKLALGLHKGDLTEAVALLAGWDKQRAKIQSGIHLLQQPAEREGQRRAVAKQQQKEGTNASWYEVLAFLDQTDTFAKSLQAKMSGLAKKADQDHRLLSGMVDAILEDIKKTLMLPFSSLLEVFPKLVRDLARDRGKEADLIIQGGEVEADRRILEQLKDPLVHLVRNCVDHGIESPERRAQKQKPSRGVITITVEPKEADKVELAISDDGAGIELAKVRDSALKLGLLTAEQADTLDEAAVLSLIFESGVSTSAIITDLSGRGLGLAIVREKVEKVGGKVTVRSQADVGTTFRILLPITLASFRGILVRLDQQAFILPTAHVIRVMAVRRNEIKTVENRETIQLNGEVLSLVGLEDALEMPRRNVKKDAEDKVHLVVLGSSEKRAAFVVDGILSEQEVLVKSLGTHLARVRYVAGAAVLGAGRVVPVLSVPDLMKSAVQVSIAPRTKAIAEEQRPAKRKSVLVAEDSITARTLLKNILESAGYVVKTAVDGADALATLRTEEFDLVVSDVDMPRMSGFDLTARIRADKNLSELPVVLVTALESRQDRERGIDVGANAYIVKSSFDQSNLLEVLDRLI